MTMGIESATLRISDVTKQYGDFKAVDDLSFEVSPGRIFGFLGPNGAGKTTTLRMIVGITAPDLGSITFKGQPISPALQNRIGYLPEERGLYKKLKIGDQLRYFAALKGVPQGEADARITRWLDRMGLSKWRDHKVTDLSKGMSQKIQFIAALIHEPDLVILDEPFSGLDPVNVEFMLGVLEELKQSSRTVIFSTHLMETAERLCEDILLINKSKKVLSGTLAEVRRSFTKNMVKLRADGGEVVLADSTFVASVKNLADEREVILADAVAPEEFLKSLVDAGARVTKFELVAPSLNDIFIEVVGGSHE